VSGAVLLDYGHTIVDFARPEEQLLEAYHRINARLESELEAEVPQAAELLRQVSEKVDFEIGVSYRSGAEQEVDIAALYASALDAIGLACAPHTLDWVIQQEQDAWVHGLVLSPHAHTTLAELRRRGLRLVIVSNAAFPAVSMRRQLHHFKLWDYFQDTIYSSEFGIRKPHRAIYEEALRLAGVPGEQAVFVGDRLREDVRGPRQLGISAVLTHEFRQEASDSEPDVPVISTLAELPAALDRLGLTG
jgi:putative hydrolase of the HAD superfamily